MGEPRSSKQALIKSSRRRSSDVAAGGKSVVARHRFYYAAPASGIGIAVPSGMKSFPTEVLPQ